MKLAFFRLLSTIYRTLLLTGIQRTSVGRSVLNKAYDIFKARFESAHMAALRPYAMAGGVVVDVGANVGFFTTRFADWVGGTGWVLAIEPEKTNLANLRDAIWRAGVESRVTVFEGVAADVDGTLYLQKHPTDSWDHKLGKTGDPVAACRLDTLIKDAGSPDVSLMKIDVQGAEMLVLDGAAETLTRCTPAIFMEVHDPGLRDMGQSAHALLTRMAALGYCAHPISASGVMDGLSVDQAIDALESGPLTYADFLFLKAT